MCIKKSRVGIAKPFRGAMKSCGLSMLGSGLWRSQISISGSGYKSMSTHEAS